MMTSVKSTERFGNRVADYIKGRPVYPGAVRDFLVEKCGLTPAWAIADVGAGTGISTRLFAEFGNTIYAVEPNHAMRAAGAIELAQYPDVSWIEGTAENTGLAPASVQMVLAAQAFHWFNLESAKQEFERILSPAGYVALLWNDRRVVGSPFLEAYEQFLQTFGTDYCEVNHRNINTQHVMDAFWGQGNWQTATIAHAQSLDWAGFLARVQSSSYIPSTEHSSYDAMLQALTTLFGHYAERGAVEIVYDARLYWGVLPKTLL